MLDPSVLKHLCLDMKVLLCPINSDSEMMFYLYNKNTNEVITETYNVDLNASGVSANLDKLLAEITIFKVFRTVSYKPVIDTTLGFDTKRTVG